MTLRIVERDFRLLPIPVTYKLVSLTKPNAADEVPENRLPLRGSVAFSRRAGDILVPSILGTILGHVMDPEASGGVQFGKGLAVGLPLFIFATLTTMAESKKVITEKTGSTIRGVLTNPTLAAIGLGIMAGEMGMIGITIAMLIEFALHALSNKDRGKLIETMRGMVVVGWAAFVAESLASSDSDMDSGTRLGLAAAAGMGAALIGGIPNGMEIWSPHRFFANQMNIKFGQKFILNSAVSAILLGELRDQIGDSPEKGAGIITIIVSATTLLTMLGRYLDQETSMRGSNGVYDGTTVGLAAAVAAGVFTGNNYVALALSALGMGGAVFALNVGSGEFKSGRLRFQDQDQQLAISDTVINAFSTDDGGEAGLPETFTQSINLPQDPAATEFDAAQWVLTSRRATTNLDSDSDRPTHHRDGDEYRDGDESDTMA